MGAFAKLLTRLREKTGLTMYALAKRAGLSHQAMSQLEAAKREPSWETIRRLRNALSCSYDDLDDGSVMMPEPTPPKPRGRPAKPKLEAKPKKARGK